MSDYRIVHERGYKPIEAEIRKLIGHSQSAKLLLIDIALYGNDCFSYGKQEGYEEAENDIQSSSRLRHNEALR